MAEWMMLENLADNANARKRPLNSLHIQLNATAPATWRRIVVTDTTTLAELYWVIQLATGWTNSHLHQFLIDEKYYSNPESGLAADFDDMSSTKSATLGKLAKREGKQFVYEYDFRRQLAAQHYCRSDYDFHQKNSRRYTD